MRKLGRIDIDRQGDSKYKTRKKKRRREEEKSKVEEECDNALSPGWKRSREKVSSSRYHSTVESKEERHETKQKRSDNGCACIQ